MSDTNKTISIQYKAEVQNLVAGLTKVGNTSEKEARRIINSLEKAYDKAARESQKSIAKQEAELERLRRQAQKTSKSMNMNTKQIAAGFAVAGVAVLGFQQHIANLSNQLVDASTKTGVAVDTLAGLRLAAEGSGLSFENLEVGLEKLPKLMNQAAEGSKTAQKAFDNLGVSVTEGSGQFETLRSADDVLKDVFESLQAVESAEKKAALAAEVFGYRAGPAFIQSGAIDNLESFMDLANEFGVSTGPDMQKQMAEFQRVSSSALTLVQGEFARLLNSIFGETGINEGIMLASQGVIAFGIMAQKQIEIVSKGFTLASGIVSNVFSLFTGGSVEEAVKSNNENLKALGESLLDVGGMFDEISERQENFRKALSKTLVTPQRTRTRTEVGTNKPNEDEKEAARIAKEQEAIQKFINTLLKENTRENVKILQQRTNLLEGVEKEEKQLQVNLEQLRLQKEEFLANVDAKIRGLEEQGGKEEELSQIQAARQERLNQLKVQGELIEKAGIIAIEDARKEADEKRKREEEKIQKQKLKNIKEQIQAVEFASSQITNLGEAGVQLFERFGEKTKENAITAFNIRKGIALAEVAINTAVGITRALAEGGIVGGVAAAGIGATGAAQAALIISEEPKFHMGGMIAGPSLAPDERRITAKSGEAVLSAGTVQRLGGEQAINRMENGGGDTPVVIVTNPFKHYDRFIKGRKMMGVDSQSTGRKGY